MTPARVVPLPLLPVPLSNAVLTLHQNVFPLQNRVGLVAGGFLDCIGLFFWFVFSRQGATREQPGSLSCSASTL